MPFNFNAFFNPWASTLVVRIVRFFLLNMPLRRRSLFPTFLFFHFDVVRLFYNYRGPVFHFLTSEGHLVIIRRTQGHHDQSSYPFNSILRNHRACSASIILLYVFVVCFRIYSGDSEDLLTLPIFTYAHLRLQLHTKVFRQLPPKSFP